MSCWYWRDGSLATPGMNEDPDWVRNMQAIEKKLHDRSYKVLKQEDLPNGRWISTVWLGLDHSFGESLPLIFETMVFDSEFNDLDQRRYSSEEEALAGHEEMLAEWSAK